MRSELQESPNGTKDSVYAENQRRTEADFLENLPFLPCEEFFLYYGDGFISGTVELIRIFKSS